MAGSWGSFFGEVCNIEIRQNHPPRAVRYDEYVLGIKPIAYDYSALSGNVTYGLGTCH
jgi:hypothetical protein